MSSTQKYPSLPNPSSKQKYKQPITYAFSKKPLLSQQFIQYTHPQQLKKNDNQTTARLHQKKTYPLPTQSQISPLHLQDQSDQNLSKYTNNNKSIQMLTTQPYLHQMNLQLTTLRQKLNKFNNLNDFLLQQNQILNYKYFDVLQKLEEIQICYQQKLQSAYSTIKQLQHRIQNTKIENKNIQTKTISKNRIKINKQDNNTNNSSNGKNNKITPIKIYNGKQQPYNLYNDMQQKNYLQDINKLMLTQQIVMIQQYFDKIQEICQIQLPNFDNIVQQHRYIQLQFQQQILNVQDSIRSNISPTKSRIYNAAKPKYQELLDLIKKYERQLINWQNYSNCLKKQLVQSIQFIDKFFSNVIVATSNNREYTNQQLLIFISKQIKEIFYKKINGKLEENKQLRVLLEDMLKQLKASGQGDKVKKNGQSN